MYFIGIDLGTSGLKAAVMGKDGNICSKSYWDTAITASKPGEMKQDIDDYFKNTLKIIDEVLDKAGIDPKKIEGVAFDGQMGGIIGIDKNFNHLTELDMNLDTKSDKYAEQFHGILGEKLTEITFGSPLNGPKILRWIKERPEITKKISKFVTLSGYIAGKFAGLNSDQAFIDFTSLSFFGIEDARKYDWSGEICEDLGIEINKLPKVVPPWKLIGGVSNNYKQICKLRTGTPIFAGAGDQPAGFLGSGFINGGKVIDVAGSTTMISVCVDDFVPDLKNKAAMYMAAVKPGIYHLYSYINGGGMSYNWLIKEVFKIGQQEDKQFKKRIQKANEIKPGSGGLLFIPYLGGRHCPYDIKLRGGWLGLNWGHKQEHLYRSILESLAYDYKLGVKNIKELFPDINLDQVYVTGGGSKNDLWNQIKSDVLGLKYLKLKSFEYALKGCYVIAAYGCGIENDFDEIIKKIGGLEVEREYIPDYENNKIYNRFYDVYKNIFDNSLKKTFHELAKERGI